MRDNENTFRVSLHTALLWSLEWNSYIVNHISSTRACLLVRNEALDKTTFVKLRLRLVFKHFWIVFAIFFSLDREKLFTSRVTSSSSCRWTLAQGRIFILFSMFNPFSFASLDEFFFFIYLLTCWWWTRNIFRVFINKKNFFYSRETRKVLRLLTCSVANHWLTDVARERTFNF